MNILSLFDGMSCSQIALDNCDFYVDNYFASEVDKYAIKITQKNYPTTIQLGDVLQVKAKNLPKIDLLIGGSPCQGFSFSGKGLNFNDPRSKLFFEFVRLLKECKPKYWLLENVFMKKEYSRAISKLLGIYPILINSADFSAQNRQRYYWTNIPYKLFWKKSKAVLEDILESNVHEKYFIKPQRAIKILDKETDMGRIGIIGNGCQGGRIYSIHGKSITINSNGGGLGANTGLYPMPCLTPDRLEKRQNGKRFKPDHNKSYTLTSVDQHGVLLAMPIQGIDRLNKRQPARAIKGENNKSYVINQHPYRSGVLLAMPVQAINNMKNPPSQTRIKDINNKSYIHTQKGERNGVLILQKERGNNQGGIKAKNGKTPTLTSSRCDQNNLLFNGRIRRLTPVECERLQTVPDGYTKGVSDTQRYKMLGNGMTVKVIEYLLKDLKINS